MSVDAKEQDSLLGENKRAKKGQSVLALFPALLIFILALFSMVKVLGAQGDQPSPKDWKNAAEELRELRGDDSLIVFAPAWIDPIGRQYVGDQMSIEMAARMDSAGYAHIWELSARESSAKEVSGLSVEFEKYFGNLRLRKYSQEPVVVSYDFRNQWELGKVSGQIRGRPSLSLEEVGFEPHRCIKVVPLAGRTVSLSFESVTLGTSIVGYVGLADVFTRRKIRSPGRLAVRVDGTEIARVDAGIDDGWVRFEGKTIPGQARVEFQLEAIGEDARDRRICFAAEARE